MFYTARTLGDSGLVSWSTQLLPGQLAISQSHGGRQEAGASVHPKRYNAFRMNLPYCPRDTVLYALAETRL